MGYNGPAPGFHSIAGRPVLTEMIHVYSKDEALKQIPQLGDPMPGNSRWIAMKPSRVEAIRPWSWSIDIPYEWAADWVAPRTTTRRYTLAPKPRMNRLRWLILIQLVLLEVFLWMHAS